ncbi:MAG TPA: hypothetical protein ENK06_12130 [Gammaproteobacteria bacterium]|nr:hypothetical protein [Gammaproteobacteria bacterium]
MSNSVLKKTLIVLFCVALVSGLIFIKPEKGYFDSLGTLIQSRLDPDRLKHNQNSLDLQKLRPNFSPGG